MDAKQPLYRFPVVIFSLLLLIGYVYVRSGGAVPGWRQTSGEPAVPADEPNVVPVDSATMLPGSKSDVLFEASPPVSEAAGLSDDEVKKALIYGSKSAPVFLPMEKPVNPNAIPVPADAALLPGSKSAAVVVPATPPLNTPRTSSTTLLPGSKSIILVEPSQAQQPQQQSANRPPR